MTTLSLESFIANARNLLSNEEAAAYIGVTPSTMQVWRSTGRFKIRHIKMGSKVLYRQSDLDAFLESRTVSE
jgi:excisionase family DNA binding protein